LNSISNILGREAFFNSPLADQRLMIELVIETGAHPSIGVCKYPIGASPVRRGIRFHRFHRGDAIRYSRSGTLCEDKGKSLT